LEYTDVEHALEAYDFEEIVEMNDKTIEDVLMVLVEAGYIKLPNPRPL